MKIKYYTKYVHSEIINQKSKSYMFYVSIIKKNSYCVSFNKICALN